jgi:hypothetical protein
MKIKQTSPVAKTARTIFLIPALALMVMLSCKTREEATQDNPNTRRLNDKEAQELLFSKDSIPFWFFSAKLGVDYASSEQSMSFSSTVKMRIDSAFSGTITVASLVFATYLVDQDSVRFTNKKDKCYMRQNFSALSEMFGTEIEYDFFQSLVLGLPVGLDPETKYKHKNTKEYYIITSDKKKKDSRHDKDENKDENKDGKDENKDEVRDNKEDHDRGAEERILVQFYINTETWHLDRIAIQVPSDGVDIEINYLNRQQYDSFYLPEQTTIKIVHPDDSITITLDYNNVKINERKEIDINIPESYSECPKKEG